MQPALILAFRLLHYLRDSSQSPEISVDLHGNPKIWSYSPPFSSLIMVPMYGPNSEFVYAVGTGCRVCVRQLIYWAQPASCRNKTLLFLKTKWPNSIIESSVKSCYLSDPEFVPKPVPRAKSGGFRVYVSRCGGLFVCWGLSPLKLWMKWLAFFINYLTLFKSYLIFLIFLFIKTWCYLLNMV